MKPLVIAHRGEHKNCFENTKEAFIAAAMGNYFGVETDLYLTKDNKWIIHHGEDFYSHGKRILIKDELFDDLLKMDIDNENRYKATCPSLIDFLTILQGTSKRPIIEIKIDNVPLKWIKEMMDIISNYFSFDDVKFISFFTDPLQKIRSINPKQDIMLLIEYTHLEMIDYAYEHNYGIDIEKCLVTKDIVDRFHKNNLKVGTWTVDDKLNAKNHAEMGVDYITSNVFEQDSEI